MTLWLSQLPTWLSFVITVVVANAVAIAVMLTARAWSYRIGVTAGPAVVNSWATCAGALCALLFAFTIVTLWNSATAARSNLDDETSAIRLAARDLAPADLPGLHAYVDASVREWPALCGGKEDPRVETLLIKLERSAQPRTAAYADDLYRQLGTVEDMRNRRWQTSTSAVPEEIWAALIVLSLALLSVLALALPDRLETHVALMIAVATALGTLFWVTTILEYPFCGPNAIRPAEMLLLARMHFT